MYYFKIYFRTKCLLGINKLRFAYTTIWITIFVRYDEIKLILKMIVSLNFNFKTSVLPILCKFSFFILRTKLPANINVDPHLKSSLIPEIYA